MRGLGVGFASSVGSPSNISSPGGPGVGGIPFFRQRSISTAFHMAYFRLAAIFQSEHTFNILANTIYMYLFIHLSQTFCDGEHVEGSKESLDQTPVENRVQILGSEGDSTNLLNLPLLSCWSA